MTNDQTRIKQIFLNLISNATKFAENGQISLTVDRQSTPKGDLVKVDVADTGIGMDEEQVGRLLNAFVQADSSTTRKYGGTGLGLTISKQLAQLMGGNVGMVSEKGKGTVFTASFALNNAGHTHIANTSAQPLITRVILGSEPISKKVLIIDDDPIISALMQRQLVKHGYAVLIAESGKEGLSLAKIHRPDAITLDILMPEIDGWSTLRALKADPEIRHIPVIMASILDEKNKGFALGAADFLSKPIEQDYLVFAVQRLNGQKKSSTICVIEDDQDLRFTVKEILEKNGAKVFEAGHGKEALSVLDSHNYRPDLISLDLLMPVMNGFVFLQQWQTTKFKSIPVLVLTGADLIPQ